MSRFRLFALALVMVLVVSAIVLVVRQTGAKSAASPLATPDGAEVSAPSAAPIGPVNIEMKNVHLHADADIVLDVAYLRGQMISRTAGQPPVFDDPSSYVMRIGAADVSMDLESLEHLLNERIFSGPNAPLTDIKVKVADDGRLQTSGKLHKGVSVPVSMKATVAATPDGRLLLHVETEKALGIPTTALLSLFGLQVDDLVKLKNEKGVEINGNDIVITPGLVVPPPQLSGKLASVTIKDGRLVQTFVRDPGIASPLRPPIAAPNYVYFRGSVLRFGKLTMSDADLEIVDADPKTPFDFFPGQYSKQLVAGYSRTTESGALVTYWPDYADAIRGVRLK